MHFPQPQHSEHIWNFFKKISACRYGYIYPFISTQHKKERGENAQGHLCCLAMLCHATTSFVFVFNLLSSPLGANATLAERERFLSVLLGEIIVHKSRCHFPSSGERVARRSAQADPAISGNLFHFRDQKQVSQQWRTFKFSNFSGALMPCFWHCTLLCSPTHPSVVPRSHYPKSASTHKCEGTPEEMKQSTEQFSGVALQIPYMVLLILHMIWHGFQVRIDKFPMLESHVSF